MFESGDVGERVSSGYIEFMIWTSEVSASLGDAMVDMVELPSGVLGKQP